MDYDPRLSTSALTAITIVQLLGYYIFRSANGEKDSFRRDPDDPEVLSILCEILLRSIIGFPFDLSANKERNETHYKWMVGKRQKN